MPGRIPTGDVELQGVHVYNLVIPMDITILNKQSQ